MKCRKGRTGAGVEKNSAGLADTGLDLKLT
jgi:hypothetical protein